MNTGVELQQKFFHTLKEYLPPHLSLAEDLSELLQISHDSVYRRIRGEKPISLAELKTICDHYGLSIDSLLQINSNSVLFFSNGTNQEQGGFDEYLKGILAQMRYFNSFSERKMFYLCKDAPVFYFFLFPEIAAFKTFFWIKSVLNIPELADQKFSFAKFPYRDCYAIGQDIIREYNKIPTVELWNYESFNSTISQIKYYKEAGIFESDADLQLTLESLQQVFDLLQKQAQAGHKTVTGGSSPTTTFDFYINEIIIGSNTILVELNQEKISILTYSVLRYLYTRDQALCNDTFRSFQNLKNRSTLISGSGEKERNRYFNTLREKLNQLLK